MQDIFNNDELQLVVLDSPYDSLNSAEEQKLFSRLMAFKLEGYSKVHSGNILPVDTSDFIGTHVIVLNKNSQDREVLMAFKSTTLKQCQRFNLEFPFLSILNKAKNTACLNEMEKIIKECEESGENISYDTGWTINPKVRVNKNLQTALKEISTMLAINYHDYFNIRNWVTFGICKVKTDQFFLKMGLQEISQQPIIKHPYLGDEEARAVICRQQKYSNFTTETAKKYESVWNQKIVLGRAPEVDLKKAS